MLLTPQIVRFLKKRDYISVGTCDLKGQPLAAPKLLLKVEGDSVYLIDFVISRICGNITKNPRVSLSAMDVDTLTGYQINGRVEIIREGRVFNELVNELRRKQISLTAARVIEGARQGKKHESFEVGFPERFIVFKVDVEQILEIYPSGLVRKEGRET